MAKLKRTVVGSVVKNKDKNKPDYIKISNDVTLKKGSILQLESKESRLKGVNAAVAAGKLSEDLGTKITEDINRTPDFVRFSIVQLSEQ